MIHNSYIFLDGISLSTEQKIWNQDIKSWDDFIKKEIPGISSLRKSFYNVQIKKAKQSLHSGEVSFFANNLPKSQHWRLYSHFKDEAVFLDIETDPYEITAITLYDGEETKTMIRDINLDFKQLKQILSQYKLIITFNGSCFDLPVLEKHYSNIIPNIPHFDLRFGCSQVGLKGGLKSIEKQLNIKRSKELNNVYGEDAVLLWKLWQRSKNTDYLDLLVKYNQEDTINLKPLADKIYPILCYTMKK